MISRLYVAPLEPGLPIGDLVRAVAARAGDVALLRLADYELHLTDLEATQLALTRAAGQGPVVVDATLPELPFGEDAVRVHTALAPHLNAYVLGVMSGQGRTGEQIALAADLVRARFAEAHQPLAGIVVTGVEDVPDATVPLIAAGEDVADKVAALDPAQPAPVSPVFYQNMLVAQAAQTRRRIVLPEADDDRILAAAAKLVALDAVDLVLLGDADALAERAEDAGLDLSRVDVVSPTDADRLERYAQELAKIREKKGVTLDRARTMLGDISYFATMMVALGEADGMVSGAIHTTAETIRPALQIIKTKPGTRTVSGAFLMLFADHVHLFADCAVTIDPTPEQLADIAVTSAGSAAAFGIDPKVALISYSTLGSGSGPSVEKVEQAVALAREAAPDLALDGPLQFDAACDPTVAATKAPASPVAGAANVFIFDHLDVGNCTYKAVQRTAGAIAVGPVLQGLRKPVNDLSRGATVDDIVNTVIITACQAE